jgi:hypothetical protein
MNTKIAQEARKIQLANLELLREAFGNIPKTKFQASDILVWIKTKCPKIELASFDGTAYLTDTQTWKDFVSIDWTRENKWTDDVFDCDNFAQSFIAHVSEVLRVSTFRFYGEKQDLNHKRIGNHYWAGFVSIDNGVKHLYFVEPEGGEIIEITGQKDITFAGGIYIPWKVYIS